MKPARAAAVVVGLCVVVAQSWPAAQPQLDRLPLTEIEAAIAFGAVNQPEPYRLRHAGNKDNPTVVGLVYTPFLRVAFESHAAAQRGVRLTPDAVSASSIESLVYIAFRWYCCDNALDPSQPRLAPVEPQVRMMRVPASSPEQARFSPFPMIRGDRPVWSRPGSDLLGTFGATPPYQDIALVAAFPLDRLTTGRTFAVFKERVPKEFGVREYVGVRWGVMRAGDAARWR